MASPDPNDALVERARAALRRLGDAAPSRDAAGVALEEIEAAWRKRPFTVGVTGDDAAARAELLDAMCGGGLLEARGPEGPAVRVRRGPATRLRAHRRDGRCEEAALPGEPAAARDERQAQADAARAQVGQHELELLRVERAVPRLARRAPPWWAFWLWMIRWLVVRRAQGKLAAWRRAQEQLAGSQRELAAAEEAAPAAARELAEARARFRERLRALCAGSEAREIELEVAGGPLADEVEVIDPADGAPRTGVDVTLRVAAARVEVAGGEGTRMGLGSPALAARGLARLPAEARARGIVRRAREVLIAELAHLDDAVARAEVALRDRTARLAELHMPDADAFVPAQLGRIRTQAAASIHAVIEHAGVHLGSELAQCAAQWDRQIAAVGTPDELKALAARIDEEGVTEYKRIAEETRTLVMGGVGGSAHDLLPEVLAELRRPGLPDEHAVPPRRVPALSRIAMLPSLSDPAPSELAGELGGAGRWIAGLFRSIDARRTELRDKVRQRSERVRAVADAEIMEAEPVLRTELLEAVGRELSAAVERRCTWLAAEQTREQLAIDAGRQAQRRLTEVVEDVRGQARGLQERIGGPAAVAAAPGVA